MPISSTLPESLANTWIVLKFGGTSVSERSRWDTIAAIAKQHQNAQRRVLIVVSAVSGVTNLLSGLCDGSQDTSGILQTIEEKHRLLCMQLEIDFQQVLAKKLDDLRALIGSSEAKQRAYAWQAEILSYGEMLSSMLGVSYLQTQGIEIAWTDARDWLTALPPDANCSAWSQRLSVSCSAKATTEWKTRFAAQTAPVLLTQGFIARHADGKTAILGRGGSDTSAAYFGSLLGAEQVEIWTDVPGMFTTNPKEVPQARLLKRLHFDEAQEIAATGAKVLHPRVIPPCREADVSISILDTQHPELPGTLIDGHTAPRAGIKALSRRDGVVLISMESLAMWHKAGYLADLFSIFRKHAVSIDMISAGQTNVTVSLDPSENVLEPATLDALVEDLSVMCSTRVITQCAAITFVGKGIHTLLSALANVFAVFGKEQIYMISQSSNDLNVTYVLDQARAQSLIQTLHTELMRSGAMHCEDDAIFGPAWSTLFCAPQPNAPSWWQNLRQELLAKSAHTPSYIYHLPTVKTQAQTLYQLGVADHLFYAIKANAHPDILRALYSEGFGFECVSANELEHVFSVIPEINPQRVLFTPSFAPIFEYRTALKLGVHLTIDNIELLHNWPDVFANQKLWLRIDLGHADGHHQKVMTGGKKAKFGLPLFKIKKFLDVAKTHNILITGLHAHLGSGVQSPTHWLVIFDELRQIAEKIPSVQTIDIGGGLPVPYRPDESGFDIHTWAVELAKHKVKYPHYKIAIEPGRYIVAQAGVLLARVTQVVKKSGIYRVGVDAGMHTLLRPALYGAWHHIENISRPSSDPMRLFDVVGPICESSDIFGEKRVLPTTTAPEDILLIADAGAYGRVMSSQYNLRPLPNEEIIAL